MRGRGTLLLVTAAVALLALLPTPARGQAAEVPPAHGITLVRDEVVSHDGRLHELTLHSATLGRETTHRLLLPAGYDDPAAAATRYPMLVLLHGADSNHRSWTEATRLEEHTAPLDLIVLMPDGGPRGFYSDWLDGPAWETFHLRELLPWIDATYRTVGTRAGRAIAGLSMGGFGSASYAARNPDLFIAMAAFSGAVDIADAGVVEAEALKALGYNDDRLWGPYLTHEASWRGHNPPDLAPNLQGMAVRLATGSGVPCPATRDKGPDVIEAGVFLMHAGFTLALQRAGVPYSIDLRPCGTHEWHYWDADIAAWLPTLMALFAEPPAPPSPFDFRTTEPQTDVWGWSFTAHRPTIEFLDLRDVSRTGLTATGSGVVDVVSAPVYEPGATYAVAATSGGTITAPVAVLGLLADPQTTLPATPAGTAAAIADPDGRLRFTH
ncbi:MAG TPA: alpha/beta hydrolase family protein, partial [Acidimicrobiales bacterium]|nr:alpha/beta hydrolase family protein [Acidimicrobiales bacterium]